MLLTDLGKRYKKSLTLCCSGDKKFVKHQNSKSAFYYTIRLATRIVLTIFYSLRVRGAENILEKDASIIVANHINWFDSFVLVALFKGKITFLSASYLFEGLIVRVFLSRMGCISVSQLQIREPFKESLNILRRRGIIGIFPEGSVRLTNKIQKVKRGAFFLAHTANVPIIPVGIQGTDNVFALFRKIPRPGKIIVNIGKPIYPKRTERETTKMVIAKITELVKY